MEQTVNSLESMFQKAESDLTYLSRKIDFELGQKNKANPAQLIEKISEIKKEYGDLVKEAASIQEAQKEAVEYFRTQLMAACQLLQALQQQTGKQDGERPEELDRLEAILGIKLPSSADKPQADGDHNTEEESTSTGIPNTAPEVPEELSKPAVCTIPEPQLSPSSRRADSSECLDITQEEFESVSELIRGRCKLADINTVYRILWRHFKEENNSKALNPGEMFKMGLKVSGNTGEAKLKVLRALKLCTISANKEVKLV
ncbi:spindle and kinetochore-associated protein 2-like [Mizuhopecten yessoensis]|uniref:Protein FAM33A n=1 Tax=Mizuhopecten yessoensis TaxID=6573 RepID=A0A210Q8A6_MIZYE|nr:spindle and kinetochore-associated protein 2-like [Mizuhopecten yessoensis]OWF44919.1 Spindle and kinetochore-associated protein 2 [Mizuhopecten yessoensis]